MEPVTAPGDNELLRYVRLVWRRLWLLLLLPLVAAGATYEVVKKTQPAQYTASATIFLESTVTQNLLLTLSGSGSGSGSSGSTESPGNAIQILESRPIALTVFNQFPDFVNGKHLFPGASATQVLTTNVIKIDVTDQHRKESAAVANVYAQTFLRYEQNRIGSQVQTAETALKKQLAGVQSQITGIDTQVVSAPTETRPLVQAALNPTLQALTTQQSTLSQRIAGLQLQPSLGSSGVQILSPAFPPAFQTSPNPKKDAEIVGAGGLILALAIIVLMEMVDDRIRFTSDLNRAVGDVPILASIPTKKKRRDDGSLATLNDHGGAVAESYWGLKAVVDHLRHAGHLASILIAGPEGTEGSSTVAANLAVTFAKSGTSVLLIDADLRRPSLASMFGLDSDRGLDAVLNEGADAHELIQSVPSVPGLSVLAAGPATDDAAGRLGTGEAATRLESLERSASVVILTAPPINRFPDAGLLAPTVDAVLIVVEKGRTGRGSLAGAVGALERVAEPKVGIVVQGSVRVPRGTVIHSLGDPAANNGSSAQPVTISQPLPAT